MVLQELQVVFLALKTSSKFPALLPKCTSVSTSSGPRVLGHRFAVWWVYLILDSIYLGWQVKQPLVRRNNPSQFLSIVIHRISLGRHFLSPVDVALGLRNVAGGELRKDLFVDIVGFLRHLRIGGLPAAAGLCRFDWWTAGGEPP